MSTSPGDADHLATEVIGELRRLGQTVATAESLTAGLVCASLTDVPGSSAVVRGGLIVYATDLKQRLAGVDAELLDREGAVHPEVARQLASGARGRCDAVWGIGLTGVAGPDPQDGVGPGTVHVAVAWPDGEQVRTLRIEGDRSAVRAGAARAALSLLREQLG